LLSFATRRVALLPIPLTAGRAFLRLIGALLIRLLLVRLAAIRFGRLSHLLPACLAAVRFHLDLRSWLRLEALRRLDVLLPL
jgi:hypothetical protein